MQSYPPLPHQQTYPNMHVGGLAQLYTGHSEWKPGYYAVILSDKPEGRPESMKHKYSETLCELTASMRHAGKRLLRPCG